MMRGIGKDGEHLIPAFPYTSYATMSTADVLDMMTAFGIANIGEDWFFGRPDAPERLRHACNRLTAVIKASAKPVAVVLGATETTVSVSMDAEVSADGETGGTTICALPVDATCTELTTLNSDDTPGRVERLCAKARNPLTREIVEGFDIAALNIRPAAVCVYHAFVPTAVSFSHATPLQFTMNVSATGAATLLAATTIDPIAPPFAIAAPTKTSTNDAIS